MDDYNGLENRQPVKGFQGSNPCLSAHDLFNGGLAQLGEHMLCKHGVIGSIPISSTIWECNSVGQSQ